MTPAQLGLVKMSFARIASRSGELGTTFYQRLFQLEPRLQELFHGSVPSQGFALFTMIDLIVRTLDYQKQVVPIIYELGKRHAAYGVMEGDYATFRTALLDTLEGALGEVFTPELREAWGSAYDFMAGVMEEAHAHVRQGRTLPYRPAPPVEEEADQ
ncbi:MAG TPA: globin domain-containing protein [Burkholderiales bacterium]